VHIGTPPRRKRIKLQLWDTAGTERFRSVSRSYYRGAAGAILIYDVSSWRSFEGLRTFLDDARALAGPDLTVILAGNKADVEDGNTETQTGFYGSVGSERSDGDLIDGLPPPTPTPSFYSARSISTGLGLRNPATIAPEGREVPPSTASQWAGENGIPVAVEVSALSGDNVDELFQRLARMILTKIELGEIDPDDPSSGIQYGDIGGWGRDDGSVMEEDGSRRRKKKGGVSSRREWEDVFKLGGGRSRGGCC
jgi:Ras-related protein Rab-4B